MMSSAFSSTSTDGLPEPLRLAQSSFTTLLLRAPSRATVPVRGSIPSTFATTARAPGRRLLPAPTVGEFHEREIEFVYFTQRSNPRKRFLSRTRPIVSSRRGSNRPRSWWTGHADRDGDGRSPGGVRSAPRSTARSSMTDVFTRLIRGNGVAESANQSPDPRTFWNQSRLCRLASGTGSLNALQPREFSGGCTGWPDGSPAD